MARAPRIRGSCERRARHHEFVPGLRPFKHELWCQHGGDSVEVIARHEPAELTHHLDACRLSHNELRSRLTADMSGGPKGAKRTLERPLDGGVRRHLSATD